MLVECYKERAGYAAHDFAMKPTEQHVVCAMFSLEAGVLLYCLDRESLLHVPAELFRVVDARLSRHWLFSHDFEPDSAVAKNQYYWGYPEFVHDANHRAALSDGERTATEVYQRYRDKLVVEFALPSIPLRATPLTNGWVMCASCSDAWQPAESADEMLRCPNCGALQHKPIPP